MAIAQSLNILLKTDTSQVSPKLAQAEQRFGQFVSNVHSKGRDLDAKMGSIYRSIGNKAASIVPNGLESRFGNTFKAIGGMALKYLGPLALLYGAGKGASWGIQLAAEAETAKGKMEVLTGSTATATKMIKDLKEYADKTPFEFPGIQAAATQLLAFGEKAENVMGKTKQLGDIAAGSGSDIAELASIYGKIMSKGKLELEQGNQFAERGVNIYKNLAIALNKSEADIKRMITAGQITSKEVSAAFDVMTGKGGDYEGATDRLANTLAGKWSTFQDTFASVFKEIGEILTDTLDLKGCLDNVTWFVTQVKNWLEWLKPVVRAFSVSIYYYISEIPSYFSIAGTEIALFCLKVYNDIENVFVKVLPTLFENFGEQLTHAFTAITDNVAMIMDELWDYLASGGNDIIELKLKPILLQEVADAFNRTITPQEKELQDEVNRQREALKKDWDALMENESNRGNPEIERKKKELQGQSDSKKDKKGSGSDSTNDALQKGSTQAADAITSFRYGVDMAQQEAQKQTALLEKNAATLDKIADNTTPDDDTADL